MGKCLTIYMFFWGITVLVQAFLHDWPSFMALRFLQGSLECAISPGFSLLYVIFAAFDVLGSGVWLIWSVETGSPIGT